MPAPHDEHPQADQPEATGDGLEGMYYEPSVNQGRHEPMPASEDDERPQEAVRQNEAYAHGYAEREARERQGEVPGHLTPGPEDPGSPPTHAASGEPDNGRVGRVRRVSRAAPGKPDGEVDPQS